MDPVADITWTVVFTSMLVCAVVGNLIVFWIVLGKLFTIFVTRLHNCRCRPVVHGCAGCAKAHPDFGRSVNPISTRGDRLYPPNYYWHTQIFRPSDGPVRGRFRKIFWHSRNIWTLVIHLLQNSLIFIAKLVIQFCMDEFSDLVHLNDLNLIFASWTSFALDTLAWMC